MYRPCSGFQVVEAVQDMKRQQQKLGKSIGGGWDPGQPQNIPRAWEAHTIHQSTNTAEDKGIVCPYYNCSLKDQQ